MAKREPITCSSMYRIIEQAGFPDEMYLSSRLFNHMRRLLQPEQWLLDEYSEYFYFLRTKVRPAKYPAREEPLIVDLSGRDNIFGVEYY